MEARNCSLLHAPSAYFPSTRRSYSYATCGSLDAFTGGSIRQELQGQVLRVGYRSNSAGWLGSFHPEPDKGIGPADRR